MCFPHLSTLCFIYILVLHLLFIYFFAFIPRKSRKTSKNTVIYGKISPFTSFFHIFSIIFPPLSLFNTYPEYIFTTYPPAYTKSYPHWQGVLPPCTPASLVLFPLCDPTPTSHILPIFRFFKRLGNGCLTTSIAP